MKYLLQIHRNASEKAAVPGGRVAQLEPRRLWGCFCVFGLGALFSSIGFRRPRANGNALVVLPPT